MTSFIVLNIFLLFLFYLPSFIQTGKLLIFKFIFFLILQVTFTDKPKINPFFFSKNLKVNEKASVFCSVSTGSPPFTFQWLKNGLSLLNLNAPRIHLQPDFSVLSIDSISANDVGNYTCIISNHDGKDSHTASLIVESWCLRI